VSKQFSQFPNGAPLLDTDRILIGRPDGSSPSGFSNYHITFLELAAALGITLANNFILLEDDASYLLLEDGVSKFIL
jgi:hypothetical protein